MATGVRQDSRQAEHAISQLEKRIDRLENFRAPTKIGIRAGESYDPAQINAIIDKVNELLRVLKNG